ncbi:hypothetical protein M422DRAFT_256413 [Sphaerobolus stellatus SS14]|uniref:Uncharacterized protein n=1 Tax=Sphaerobolus stellatus (strain SS14) TaxID=990650 RepID=A0A0C9VRU2_SPHS4|nr:hypothetical protein M422DRAFT_256413 [Sphaerobolus stellatus SS14]
MTAPSVVLFIGVVSKAILERKDLEKNDVADSLDVVEMAVDGMSRIPAQSQNDTPALVEGGVNVQELVGNRRQSRPVEQDYNINENTGTSGDRTMTRISSSPELDPEAPSPSPPRSPLQRRQSTNTQIHNENTSGAGSPLSQKYHARNNSSRTLKENDESHTIQSSSLQDGDPILYSRSPFEDEIDLRSTRSSRLSRITAVTGSTLPQYDEDMPALPPYPLSRDSTICREISSSPRVRRALPPIPGSSI